MSEKPELTLEDFKQEVAEKYGHKDFDSLLSAPYSINAHINEAAELWGQYCREEGKKEGRKDSVLKFDLVKRCYDKAWNDALHWAAENAKAYYPNGTSYHDDDGYPDYDTIIDKRSILSGLKTTDSNKEE